MLRGVANSGRHSVVQVSCGDIAHSSVERSNRRPTFSAAAALLLLISALLLSCGDNTTKPTLPEALLPASVGVLPASATLSAVDATVQLEAEVRDQNGQVMAAETIAWGSGASSVATVDTSGLVTAVGDGTTTITATAGSAAGSSRVTVAQEVSAVVVAPDSATVLEGDTLRLAATATDANGHHVSRAEFVWSSSDTLVVVVDGAGLVTGVGGGEATVTATAGEGSFGQARITVRPLIDSVVVDPTADTIAPGDTLRLHASALDARGNAVANVEFAWSSSDTLRVVVDDAGLVTGVGVYDATVTATAGDGSFGQARITVLPLDIVVDPPADTIAPGDTLRLRATALDANGHAVANVEFTWGSRHQAIATVNDSGLVLGIRDGVTTIGARILPWSIGNSEITVISPDRAVLVALFDALGGPGWKRRGNWLTDAPLKAWHGVNTKEGRVTGLHLADNNLQGSIPREIGQLSNLEVLDLQYNALTGPIPPEIGNLANLESLRIARGTLALGGPGVAGVTGSIPPELGKLTKLKLLDLRANRLTGPIPPELGRLRQLEVLWLANNGVTGPIPPELGDLASLRNLYLTGTRVTALPAALGKLANLESLTMQFTPVTGPIPPELGNLAKLKRLQLSFSPNLTGSIPAELGNLSNLEELVLARASLTGSIPPELGNLANLKRLGLHVNRLQGSIPPELGNLAGLESLRLEGNELTGPIPPELGGLVSLRSMDLGANELTGPIPAELGRLASLEVLYLYGNQLTSIPHGLDGMERLLSLHLGGNRLTSDGLPPGVFADLPSLEQLDLANNELTELPAGMFLGVPRLSELRLDRNPGYPFTLTLETIRTDSEDASTASPARIAVRLVEGAPVDLRVPLSAHGGELSADAVVLEAGSDWSAEVTVTRRSGRRGGTEVVAGPLPLLPRVLSGLRLESAGSLVLFGSVSNRSPVPVRDLPWMRMREGDEPRQVPVSSYFDDPDEDELTYSAESTDSGVVSVSVANDRLRVAPLAMGSTTIVVTATDDAGLAAESAFPVSVRGVREGSYTIDLIMTGRPGDLVEAAFEDAVEYWESILAETELPDVPVGSDVALGCRGVTSDQSLEVIDDLAIVASVGEVDGQGRTLGWAAVCGIRKESHFPLIGVVRFDSEDLELLRESDALEEVILHEIGHVLGFGTVWDEHGLLINPSLRDGLGTDTHFRGPLAIVAFDEAGGDIYTGGEKVPVENYAGRGSSDVHWRESVLDHELMTPRLNLRVSNPLSATTIQSLADMGYTVDVRLAEPFQLPGVAAARDQEVRKIDYGDDVRHGPIMVFDRDGGVVRIVSN